MNRFLFHSNTFSCLLPGLCAPMDLSENRIVNIFNAAEHFLLSVVIAARLMTTGKAIW
jgi:hypothetical protein